MLAMLRHRRSSTQPIGSSDPLRRRCARLAREGEYRKAAVALRQLLVQENDAATWVRLGVMLVRARRVREGIDALKQGSWMHRQARQGRKVEVIERLIAGALLGSQTAA